MVKVEVEEEIIFSDELMEWWQEHKEIDRKRIEYEKRVVEELMS